MHTSLYGILHTDAKLFRLSLAEIMREKRPTSLIVEFLEFSSEHHGQAQ